MKTIYCIPGTRKTAEEYERAGEEIQEVQHPLNRRLQEKKTPGREETALPKKRSSVSAQDGRGEDFRGQRAQWGQQKGQRQTQHPEPSPPQGTSGHALLHRGLRRCSQCVALSGGHEFTEQFSNF